MAGRDQRNLALCYMNRIGEITIQGRVLYKISIDMFILVLNTALFELRKKIIKQPTVPKHGYPLLQYYVFRKD